MAVLTVQQVNRAGVTTALTGAAGGGDTFAPGEHTMLRVKNDSGASVTVTVTSYQTCNQGATHNAVATVAAGTEQDLGPFPADRFANPSDGLVHVGYSAVTSLTVGAISV